jgi:hypothetical protein
MARVTVYLVQAFVAGTRRSQGPEAAPSSEEAARGTAERPASSKIGVVALSSSDDAEAGDYDDEPLVILRIGGLFEQKGSVDGIAIGRSCHRTADAVAYGEYQGGMNIPPLPNQLRARGFSWRSCRFLRQ